MQIFGNVTDIACNVSGIAGNVSGIAGNVSGIAGKVSDIAGNVSGIAGNVSDIADIAGNISDEVYIMIMESFLNCFRILIVDIFWISVHNSNFNPIDSHVNPHTN